VTERPGSPLLSTLLGQGGVQGAYHGRALVRHFGDPPAEYASATAEAAVFDRSHRTRLVVRGRAPRQMLTGVLTGVIPDGPRETGGAGEPGRGPVRTLRATYHAVLTPKGKMITDLWAVLPGDEESVGFLLDVPVAGGEPLASHLRKVLPPRFAALEEVSEAVAAISVVGPRAAEHVSRLALEGRVRADELAEADEGSCWMIGDLASGCLVMRTQEVWPVALTVYGSTEAVRSLWTELVDAGVQPAGLGVWSTLRVEAGRPAFGTDMDEGTIPTEAGIQDRAIDPTKGCYTGQEVIVRIRDRGHVNRRLVRLELGDVPTPPSGAELRGAGEDGGKVVGHVTSAVQSPQAGGVIALAYVRRGVETVTLDGREITVPQIA